MWEAEHVGTAELDDARGRLTVRRTDPIVRVNLDWLRGHGFGHAIQVDGSLLLDPDHRYRHLRDLGGPFAAYERV